MFIRNNVRGIIYDIVDNEYCFLLIKARKGYWQNPQGGRKELTGQLRKTEGEIEALLRETSQKTGLDNLIVYPQTRSMIEYDAPRKGEHWHIKLSAYAVKTDSKQKIILSKKEGHTSYAWVDYNTALEMLDNYPEPIIIFKEVVEKLKQIN
ncbi:MAG: NUDIX domain-containing protein [Nanoarchaeota archaeon]|nr:NUDIX domain-containing protein [Nanoarchaeota archaeon]MBU4116474.1 NUDIX domain-containing protein [Nanoarchaeota archaeon]